MKYRMYSTLPDEDIPGVYNADGKTALTGRTIIPAKDNVGYMAYEIRPAPGHTVIIRSPNPEHTNHFYYCLYGRVDVDLNPGQTYTLEENCVLAVPPAVTGSLQARVESSRIFIIHNTSNNPDPSKPDPAFRKMSEIIGRERDIDWGRGHSRRFLVRDDGFNLSIHNTVASPGFSSPLCYKNNIEGAYCIRGDIRYTWDNGEAGFRQLDHAAGDSWLILMDKNDPHVLHIGEVESEAVCIFYPPLHGTETHDFSSEGYSSF